MTFLDGSICRSFRRKEAALAYHQNIGGCRERWKLGIPQGKINARFGRLV